MSCREMQQLSVKGSNCRLVGLAELCGALNHNVEHWPEITRVRVDDAEHLRRRGLLLQRLARLGNEPRVLHGDDRLSGEVLKERNLLVGEGAHFLAIGEHPTEQHVILDEGDKDAGSRAEHIGGGAAYRIAVPVRVGVGDVDDVNETLAADDTAEPGIWARLRPVAPHLEELPPARITAIRCEVEILAVIGEYHADNR